MRWTSLLLVLFLCACGLKLDPPPMPALDPGMPKAEAPKVEEKKAPEKPLIKKPPAKKAVAKPEKEAEPEQPKKEKRASVGPPVFSPVVVTGGSADLNRRLKMAMFHSLSLHGYDIRSTGTWHISGSVITNSVEWLVLDENDSVVVVFQQDSLTEAGVAAIFPGLVTYLPAPNVKRS